MRQAGALAPGTSAHLAFQRKLIDQPLMRAVLADLALDVEAAVAVAFRLAQAIDRAGEDPREAALARIGLPIAKYLVTKRVVNLVAEAMECLGGAGFVEEAPMARIFRQSPLNAIWEGSGNVIALDLLRALGREPDAREALLAEVREAAAGDRALAGVAQEVEDMLMAQIPEPAARHAIERLGLGLMAATLSRHGEAAVVDGFVARRVRGASLTFGAGEGAIDEAALIGRLGLRG